jgi:hypothetical protein
MKEMKHTVEGAPEKHKDNSIFPQKNSGKKKFYDETKNPVFFGLLVWS